MSDVLSIVINNNILRIAQVSRTAAGIRVRNLLEKECPENMVDDSTVRQPEAFAGFVKLQLNNAGMRARDIVFTLPADKVMTREVVLPDLSDVRIRQIVDTNAGEYFPINLDDYVIGFYKIAAVRAQNEAGETKKPEGQGANPEADELANDEDVEITSFEDTERDSGKKKKKKPKKEKASRKARKKAREEAAEGEEGDGKKNKERGEVRVMAVAAPNEMVAALYETAGYLRMHVDSIDFIGNSVFRLAEIQVGKEPTLTIDISGDHTSMTFFDSGEMIMQRNIDFGLDQTVEVVARERWVSTERADELMRKTELINEDLPMNDPIVEPLYFAIDMIRRTMMYYTRNRGKQPVEKVLLMGDAVYYKGVRELLESQLAVPVKSLSQLKGVTVPRAVLRDHAMRYLDNYGAVLQPVGFLSQELSKEKEKSSGKKIYRIVLTAVAIVSLVLLAVPLFGYIRLRRQTSELSAQVESLRSADSVLTAYNSSKLKGDDVRNVNGLTASNNDHLSDFIDQLETVRPTGLNIENFTIDEGSITMNVLASGKDVVAAMLRGLQTMDGISEVEASALTSFYDGSQETVSCTISCLLTSKEKKDYEAMREQEAVSQ